MVENLIKKLNSDSYITLETTPLHSATFEPILENIENLGLGELVDGFSTTDSPLSKMKYSALFAALKLQQRFKKAVIATMSMRDRNKIAIQSSLLGANDVGIRTILALTGDPIKLSDQPDVKGVFEANSNLLLDIVDKFNQGYDFANREFKQKPKQIYPFSVMNSYAKSEDRLYKKMLEKITHKTTAIITQPVYSKDNAKNLQNMLKRANSETKRDAKLILGFFPITKYKTAKFLVEKLPGVYVPDIWVEKLEIASKKGVKEEYRVGYEMSLETLKQIYEINPKIHIMTANNFSLAKELISEIR